MMEPDSPFDTRPVIPQAKRWYLTQPMWIATGYLTIIMLAEMATTFVDPRFGLIIHSVLLAGLLIHTALVWEHRLHRMLLPLTFAPLIRLLSLSLPLRDLEQIYWYFVVSLPLFVVALMVIRLLNYSLARTGLTLRGLGWQLLIALSGIGFGYIEYLILRPEPLIDTLTFGNFVVPALILLISTGLMEELIFRGIILQTASEVIGRWRGLLFATAIFAVLHIGYESWKDMLFVFIVGGFWGVIWMKTRSIVGISLAHGLTNIMLFLVIPFWVDSNSASPSALSLIASVVQSTDTLVVPTSGEIAVSLTPTVTSSDTPTHLPTKVKVTTITPDSTSTPTRTQSPTWTLHLRKLTPEFYHEHGLILKHRSDLKKLDTKSREISERRPVAVHGNEPRIQQGSSIPKLNRCVWSYKHPR